MIERLRELNSDFIITGAPQCPTSDDWFYMKEMIQSAKFDALFVQFYNNPWCDAVAQGLIGEGFNYDKWVEIIEESEFSKEAKLYVGLPASADAAPGGGYLEPKDMKDLVCELTESPHFGGISLWDLTRGAGNIVDGKSYNEHVMDALKYGCEPVPVPTTTSSAMTTTTEEASTSTDATTTEVTTTEATTTDTTTTSGAYTTTDASSAEDTTTTDTTTASDFSSTDASSTEDTTATSEASASASTDATSSTASTDATASTSSTDATASTDAAASTETSVSTGADTSSVAAGSATSDISATATQSSADITEVSATGSVLSSDASSATSDLTATTDASLVTGAASTSTADIFTDVSGVPESTASDGETEPATISTAYSTFRGWNTTSTAAPAYTQTYGNPTTLVHSGSVTTKGSPIYTNYPGNTNAISMTTSTVCTTRVHTVTKCPPEVIDCPYGSVTTETIPLYTTVCPVTAKAEPTGYASQYAAPPQYETRTVYTTSVHTVTKCAPNVVNCPYGSVTTETIPVYTTICPVTEAVKSAPTNVPVNHEIKTLYTSHVHTVAQCPAENPNCQVGAVTTEIASWTTTIVPAKETQGIKDYKPAGELPEPLTAGPHLNGTVYTSIVVPPATLKTATKPGVFEQAKPTYKQPAREQPSGAAAPTGGHDEEAPVEIHTPAHLTPVTAGASSMTVGLTALAGLVLLQVLAL